MIHNDMNMKFFISRPIFFHPIILKPKIVENGVKISNSITFERPFNGKLNRLTLCDPPNCYHFCLTM